jgi:hypothetical protein
VRDGEVWVATRTRYADGDAHWRNRLRQGMEHNIGLVIAKAVFGLIGEGIDPRILVREAALFGTRHRDGWGAGLTVLTALGNLLPLLPNDDLCLALFQGIRRVASDCDGAVPPQPRQALTGDGRASSTLERWLRDWVLVRHRDGAERTLLTAITGGASAERMAELMLIASTERSLIWRGALFVDYDHLAAGFVGLHHAMGLSDVLETEDSGGLDVEPTGRGVRGNLLKRHVRERKSRSPEHEAAEEGQIDAARHLQQRVEVGDGIETAKPASQTRTAAAAKHGEGIEHDRIAHQIEHRIDLLRLRDALRQTRRSISQRSAPSFSSMAKRSRLRVVTITRTPALTAILSAAWPNEEVAPRMTSNCPFSISRLRNRQVQAVA